MYSVFFHAHQKLDKVARRHLGELLKQDNATFPSKRQILKFEGIHGPDGTKLKKLTGNKEPWQFLDPDDLNDTDLREQIKFHYDELVKHLRLGDKIRAGFDAAWLAHALIDGLTPAHHYPYEQELAEIRGDKNRHSRKTWYSRLYVEADTVFESVQRSLKLVGPTGLLTNHTLFEAGAFVIILPLRLNRARPSRKDLKTVLDKGVIEVFDKMVQEISSLKLYDRYVDRGWIYSVARDARVQMAPRMVLMITLAWYAAYKEAAKVAS